MAMAILSWFYLFLATVVPIQQVQTHRPDEWPMRHHDSHNTAYSSDRVKPPFRLSWRVQSGLQYTRDPYVPIILATHDVVCIGLTMSEVWEVPRLTTTAILFDQDGKRLWTMDKAEPAYLHNDLLVVVRSDQGENLIEGYQWKTRRRLWSYSIGRSEFFDLIEQDGRLFCSYGDFSSSPPFGWRVVVAILNPHNGRPLQKQEGFAVEALGDNLMFWGVEHWLHVVDARTLKPIWGIFDGGWNPVLIGSFVLTQGWEHVAHGIDIRTRKEIWKKRAWRGSAHSLARTSTGTNLIIEDLTDPPGVGGIVVATGEIRWRREMICGNGTAGAGPFVFIPGGYEHLPGQKAPKGGFYCLDADTGRPRWSYERLQVMGTAMIVRSGDIYGLDSDGFLYKFISADGPGSR